MYARANPAVQKIKDHIFTAVPSLRKSVSRISILLLPDDFGKRDLLRSASIEAAPEGAGAHILDINT